MRVVILGGGSAGWLTAGILAAEFQADSSVSIHLVEAPDIPTIGVGEGTWPTMRSTLSRIGISEVEFIRECSASFKQGSTFVGWATGKEDDTYYHPFTPPFDESCQSPFSVWQALKSEENFSAVVCSQPALCELNKAPKQVGTPDYAGVLNYGYHLDAGKFGELLRRHCTIKLGVLHSLDRVIRVESTSTGDIAGLVTETSGLVEGDLFIDCSGEQSLLIGKHFKVPFVDRSDLSINDTALAVQVPYESGDAEIASATIATAHESGWTWDIGLQSRRGVGYVYSSQFCDDETARSTLINYLGQSVSPEELKSLTPRKIKINPGYRECFWYKNCVAVGMAAGFIEPLEASALALVELSAKMVRDELPRSQEAMAVVASRFNAIFHYRWQKILEFLKLHYVLSSREDTPYWREVTRLETAPQSLQDLLLLWRDRPPNQYDFLQTEELFPAISYQYVLYGMGFETKAALSQRCLQEADKAAIYFNKVASNTTKFAAHLPTNRQLTKHIVKNNLVKK